MKTYSQLEGDGGSQVLEQVLEQKRKIAERLSTIDLHLAIGSGKGGVGKSTLTMLLAVALIESGRRVAVLDADLNGPSQARLGGLAPSFPVPGDHGLIVPKSKAGVGVVSFGQLFPEPQAIDFPSVASGESHVWRATREFSVLSDLLAGSDWTPFDTLLYDLPPGAERTLYFAEFLPPATRFIVITVPADLSRGVVARSISALRKTGAALSGYIENMKGYVCPSCGDVGPLYPASSGIALEAACLGEVPFDPGLAKACDRGLASLDELGEAVSKPIRKAASRLHPALENVE